MIELDKNIIGIKRCLLCEPQNLSDATNLKPDLYPEVPQTTSAVPAAVLIALVRRENHYSVLYTERSKNLRSHSGQIAFPGGKIDVSDKDAAAAAIREAEEELAIKPQDVEILGYMDTMFTGTNYLITPVVGIVRPSAPFIANEQEVASFFEVPLDFLMRATSYQSFDVWFANRQQKTWKIEFEKKIIWGITAHLTRHLWDLALKDMGNDS